MSLAVRAPSLVEDVSADFAFALHHADGTRRAQALSDGARASAWRRVTVETCFSGNDRTLLLTRARLVLERLAGRLAPEFIVENVLAQLHRVPARGVGAETHWLNKMGAPSLVTLAPGAGLLAVRLVLLRFGDATPSCGTLFDAPLASGSNMNDDTARAERSYDMTQTRVRFVDDPRAYGCQIEGFRAVANCIVETLTAGYSPQSSIAATSTHFDAGCDTTAPLCAVFARLAIDALAPASRVCDLVVTHRQGCMHHDTRSVLTGSAVRHTCNICGSALVYADERGNVSARDTGLYVAA